VLLKILQGQLNTPSIQGNNNHFLVTSPQENKHCGWCSHSCYTQSTVVNYVSLQFTLQLSCSPRFHMMHGRRELASRSQHHGTMRLHLFFLKKKNGNDWLQLIFMSWKSRAAPEREPGKDAPLNQINPQSPHSSRGNDSQFLFSFHTRTEYWLDCKLHRRIAIAYITPLSHTNKRNFSVFQKERCCGICESPWAIQ
jgi:hypothetical protein